MANSSRFSRVALPAVLAASITVAAPAWSAGHSEGGVSSHSMVSKSGVVSKANPMDHLFVYKSGKTPYKVTCTSKSVWSSELEKHLAIGWHVIVKGELNGPWIAATKIVNDAKPERAACTSDVKTINVAVAAYEAISGKIPPSVASLTTKAGGGPYLQHAPPNGTFFRIALNWGGASPGKENGGRHPGEVFVAPVWIGKVGKYSDYDTEGERVCNTAT